MGWNDHDDRLESLTMRYEDEGMSYEAASERAYSERVAELRAAKALRDNPYPRTMPNGDVHDMVTVDNCRSCGESDARVLRITLATPYVANEGTPNAFTVTDRESKCARCYS